MAVMSFNEDISRYEISSWKQLFVCQSIYVMFNHEIHKITGKQKLNVLHDHTRGHSNLQAKKL